MRKYVEGVVSGYNEEKKRIELHTDWDPSTMFSNSQLGKIYTAVEDSISIFFSYDLIDPNEEHIPAIFLKAKGSAEIAWLRCREPEVKRFAMDLDRNELFDPKDEGIIYLYDDTHQSLARGLRSIAYILRENSEE